MLNFSLLGQALEFLLLKHYYGIYSMCQKTDQMGIPKIFTSNFSQNYPIATYSICLQSYDQGLSNKPKCIT